MAKKSIQQGFHLRQKIPRFLQGIPLWGRSLVGDTQIAGGLGGAASESS